MSFARPIGDQFDVHEVSSNKKTILIVIQATSGCKDCYYDSDCLSCKASEKQTGVCEGKYRDDFVSVIFKKKL